MLMPGRTAHLVQRVGWLRAAVLGANDGIISTSSLLVGIAAADVPTSTVLLTGLASLLAGAISMAAGEYVSVKSQADVENSDRLIETAEHAADPVRERAELAELYRKRGLDADLAEKVADQLTARDAVGTHLREELGITAELAARPIQAALASAGSFCVGAILPVLMVLIVPRESLIQVLTAGTLILLAILGAVGARAAGVPMWRGALRVAFWGALAMAATAAIGSLFGTRV